MFEELDVDVGDDGELVGEAIDDALCDVFYEFGWDVHLLFYNVVDLLVVEGVEEVVGGA